MLHYLKKILSLLVTGIISSYLLVCEDIDVFKEIKTNPSPLNPINCTVLSGNTVLLDWSDVQHSDYYIVTVNNVQLIKTTESSYNFNITNPVFGSSYNWHILAGNEFHQTRSAIPSFYYFPVPEIESQIKCLNETIIFPNISNKSYAEFYLEILYNTKLNEDNNGIERDTSKSIRLDDDFSLNMEKIGLGKYYFQTRFFFTDDKGLLGKCSRLTDLSKIIEIEIKEQDKLTIPQRLYFSQNDANQFLHWNYEPKEPGNSQKPLIEYSIDSEWIKIPDHLIDLENNQVNIASLSLPASSYKYYKWRITIPSSVGCQPLIREGLFGIENNLMRCPEQIGPLIWEEVPLTHYPINYEVTGIYDPINTSIIIISSYQIWQIEDKGTEYHSSLLQKDLNINSTHIEGASVFDPVHERLLLFSPPSRNQIADSNVYSLSLDENHDWRILSVQNIIPPARHEHAAIFDPLRNRYLIFGGFLSDESLIALNDLWELNFNSDPISWNSLTTLGEKPKARGQIQATYLSETDSLIFYGGNEQEIYTGSGPKPLLDDLWEIKFNTNKWNKLHPSGTSPGLLFEHSLEAIDGCRVGITHGTWKENDNYLFSSGFFIYNHKSNKWENVEISGDWPTCGDIETIFDYDDGILYAYGGLPKPGLWKLSGF
jgi:N-acetylneuraminic acid mutarotase